MLTGSSAAGSIDRESRLRSFDEATARQAGRGLVLVGPHIGAFDFFMLTIAARGYQVQRVSIR